eukprot:1859548-Rhodomonas_salina.2
MSEANCAQLSGYIDGFRQDKGERAWREARKGVSLARIVAAKVDEEGEGRDGELRKGVEESEWAPEVRVRKGCWGAGLKGILRIARARAESKDA